MKVHCPYCKKKAKEEHGAYTAESFDDKNYCVTIVRRICTNCGSAFYTIEAVDILREEERKRSKEFLGKIINDWYSYERNKSDTKYTIYYENTKIGKIKAKESDVIKLVEKLNTK